MHLSPRLHSWLRAACPWVFGITVCLAFGVGGCTRENPSYRGAESAGDVLPSDAPYEEDEVIVRFSAAMTAADVALRVEPWGGRIIADLGRGGDDPASMTYLEGTFRIGVPPDMTVEEILPILEAEPDVEFAEPNYIYEAVRTPDDADFNRLWGMSKISAPGAWEISTGSAQVVVAVVDTGVLYTHPDLADNIWTNPGEIAGNGIDDDDNGYVDDIHGWDFCNRDADPLDDHFHGTHCAGTIAGVGNNAQGVAGVAWQARIMALKFLCSNGYGNTAAATLAVIYAADNGAALTSNSWGGGGRSQSLYNAIEYAMERDSLFVAAAGNNGRNIDRSNSYPAGYDLPNILSVAASDSGDRRAYFSNYGAARVDLAAPGVYIWSTVLGNRYGYASGTSMATPHVAGAAALLLAYRPGLSWTETRDALLRGVDPLPQWAGVVATGGRLNVLRSMDEILDPPPAPTGVIAVPNEEAQGVDVSWDVSPDESVTRYRIYTRIESGEDVPPAESLGRENTSTLVPAVDAGRGWISVSAVNASGEGPRSEEVEFVVVDSRAPARILDLSATSVPGDHLPPSDVAVSSEFGVGWRGELLADGDPTTAWAALPAVQPVPEHVVLDLGEVRTVGSVALRAATGFLALFPVGFEIRVGARTGDWLVVTREIAYPRPDSDGWHHFTFAAEEARYVEIRITEPATHESGLYYAVIADVAVFAPPEDATSLLVSWTAPGDDFGAGQASVYELRGEPGLTVEGFDAAPRFEIPEPAPAGTREAHAISNLQGETVYGLAVTAIDDAGNRGELSPIAHAATGAVPPGAIVDLEVEEVDRGVDLSFTAPADDGLRVESGPAARYVLLWSDRPINGASWPAAQVIEEIAAPGPPRQRQVLRLDELPDRKASRHHFRLAAVDRAELRGPWSNEVSIDARRGADRTPPAAVRDLNALYLAAEALPLPLMPDLDVPDEILSLIDGDVRTGWMVELDDPADGEDADRAAQITFEVGELAHPLTRVRLQPHLLYPGDFPSSVEVIAVDPLSGADVLVAAQQEIAVEPGMWLELDFAPVATQKFTIILRQKHDRFGLTVVALSEVEGYEALAGGGIARLTWVAPGDDEFEGIATRYDIRRSHEPIESLDDFERAWPVAEAGELPAPAPAGELEVYAAGRLPEGSEAWFALRTQDEAGLWSDLSNAPSVRVPAIPPSAVANLRVTDAGRDWLVVEFTAPGNDGAAGTAEAYDLRYTLELMNGDSFARGFRVPTPPPQVSGQVETVRVLGLVPGTLHEVALVALDETGASSGLSNVAQGTTLEGIAPERVTTLVATAVEPAGTVLLEWRAPGDDGNVGQASAYEARYGADDVTAENFHLATPADIGDAVPKPAGQLESRTIEGLRPETTYHFALVAYDEVPNRSEVSISAPVTTLGMPPDPVEDLRVTGRGPDFLVLAWSAPGDNGGDDPAARYDLRVSTSPIDVDNFEAAIPLVTRAPSPPGSAEGAAVDQLDQGRRYHFGLVALDEQGNRSALATVSAETDDVTPPEAIDDLEARALPAGAMAAPAAVLMRSSAYVEEAEADRVRDGNPATAWVSGLHPEPRPEWIVLDLGATYEVDRIRLMPAQGYLAYFPTAFTVSVAVDDPTAAGPDARIVLDESDPPVQDNAWLDRRFAAESARYVRIETPSGVESPAGYLVAIGEIEIFGGEALNAGGLSASLTWSAPADNGSTGRADHYVLYRAQSPIDEARLDDADVIPAPEPHGARLPHEWTVSGLGPETTYHFAILSFDAAGNRSALSNSAVVLTPGIPPGTVVDLRAEAIGEEGLTLRWTAPGGDGHDGQAARYDLRWTRGMLNPDTFDDASPVADVPVPQPARSIETLEIADLEASTTYRFGLRAEDADGNGSALSNVLTVRTADPPERIPPARVVNLEARTFGAERGAISLNWMAPGDDGALGRATRYDVRWSTEAISAESFELAASVPDLHRPRNSGTLESLIVRGLEDEARYHFALKTYDDVGNVSEMSNVADAETAPIPPARIEALTVEPEAGAAQLTWTAPGSDGDAGQAARYEIYLADLPFGVANLEHMEPLAGAPEPQPAGQVESHRIDGLAADATHYVAIRAVDDHGHAGLLSPVVSFATPDDEPPGPFVGLAAADGQLPGSIALTFTAPGDDGPSGRASAFKARWSTTAFGPADFDAARPYEGQIGVVAGGLRATRVLTDLPDESRIWIGLRAFDNADQAGPVSDVVAAWTPGVAPGRVMDLRATADGATKVRLDWTAPGDDGAVGQASRYEVRTHTTMLFDGNWAEGKPVDDGVPEPAPADTPQHMVVGNLESGQVYYFAVRAIDERDQMGPTSNSPRQSTDDVVPPGKVENLTVEPHAVPGALRLQWTSAGDDGRTGRATTVEIRYAPTPWPGFDQALVWPQQPVPVAAESVQQYDLVGLAGESAYAVALLLIDEAGNRGPASNVATAATAPVAPGTIMNLQVEPVRAGTLRLAWIAPADNGDDAASGSVTGYEIAYGQSAFVPPQFDDQEVAPGPAPAAPGEPQSHELTGLADDTAYWIAVRALDEREIRGQVGEVVEARTPDVEAPAAVLSLHATGPRTDEERLTVATVTASGSLSVSWPPTAAFDDQPTTAWASPPGGDGGVFIEAQLAGEEWVGGVELYVGEWVNRFPADFDIELDGEVVTSVLGFVGEADKHVRLQFPSRRARAVRLSVQRAGGDDDLGYVVINEMSVIRADDPPDAVVLGWVAPGDDGNAGRAAAYDLRYSTERLTPANFADALIIRGPAPAAAGTPQKFRVANLEEQTTYFFALTTHDEAGNVSALSNVAHATTGLSPLPVIGDLVAHAGGPHTVELSWSSPVPCDDGAAAQAEGDACARRPIAGYEIRHRPHDLSDATWAFGQSVEAPAVAAPGEAQSLVVDALLPQTLYAFGVRTVDDEGRISLLSPVARALTDIGADEVAPAAIANVVVTTADGDGLPLNIQGLTASGSQFPEYSAQALIDDDLSTAWASPARGDQGQEVLTLTLAGLAAVNQVWLRPHDDLAFLFPSRVIVEGSVDGSAFAELAGGEEPTPEPGAWQSWTFDPISVRIIRLRVERQLDEARYLVAMAEVALYEADSPGTVTLEFTAPGDDGNVGQADHYLVATGQEAPDQLDDEIVQAAPRQRVEMAPAPAGVLDAITLQDLPAGQRWFAVWAVDEVGHVGPLGAPVYVDVP